MGYWVGRTRWKWVVVMVTVVIVVTMDSYCLHAGEMNTIGVQSSLAVIIGDDSAYSTSLARNGVMAISFPPAK